MGILNINQDRAIKIKLDKAQEILPLMKSLTRKYSERVDALIEQIERTNINQIDQLNVLEDQLNSYIREWYQKINKLGGKPKGLWIVEFDFGGGYLCWRYPEEDILYWHSYNCGFKERILIENKKYFV